MLQVGNNEKFPEMIIKSADLITDVKDHRVVIFGNGGNTADAQHNAVKYISRFQMESWSLDMEALTVNTPVLTVIGNDYSDNNVFSRQIEEMTRELM